VIGGVGSAVNLLFPNSFDQPPATWPKIFLAMPIFAVEKDAPTCTGSFQSFQTFKPLGLFQIP
jgi:hypothetical protein